MPSIATYDFLRAKYGSELLVDVARVPPLENYVLGTTPHQLSFYEILFVVEGAGTFWLDGDELAIRPRAVFFTSPGQVRIWAIDRPEAFAGVSLFFPSEFLTEFFADPLFLSKLQFFHTGSGASVQLGEEAAGWLGDTLGDMAREIRSEPPSPDAPHVLRALLYLILVRLNRAYARRRGGSGDLDADPVVQRFRQLVEAHFREAHGVAWYADVLGISPRRLHDRVRRQLGDAPGEVIRRRVFVQAKREVLYSDATIAEIAEAVGFADPSYFSRFFARYADVSPREMRAWSAEKYPNRTVD